ncbi:N-succinylarginine dihydrolase [Azospirillum halopraeferens]|uniref:N-succinylarginine dihydrolase n=1 Tax=Azospirillum halopraeferens TaxID=34010 RepID=UPI0003FA5E3C|nr:N-succinylarginine dihydrolase [Azospirillum halopraeferens]
MSGNHTTAVEANFDGLPGPTHTYAGLSYGNVASAANARTPADPRAAARQGLAKMRLLAGRGFVQGVLPPHERPHLPTLRALGFTGSDAAVLEAAWRAHPGLLAACASASAMWTANAATVSPAPDTADGRLHLTPANLVAMPHRAIEAAVTARVLRAVFPEGNRFAHHPPLPAHAAFGDEGAANHTRLAAAHGAPGVEFFVYGRTAFDSGAPAPTRFPARQTFEASAAVARRHGLIPARTVFARQNPALIDAGAFHNDVVCVGSAGTLFFYEDAFADTPGVLDALRRALAAVEAELTAIAVPAARVSVNSAIRSYLFNSQLLLRPDGGLLLVLPAEAREDPAVRAYVEDLLSSGGPIREALHVDLRQSMRNGGGPACLRLRVVLTDADRAAANPAVFLDDALAARLEAWVDRHYRDRLTIDDLRDPGLADEGRRALDELTGILRLGPVYDFQQ